MFLIRPIAATDVKEVVAFSLRAWAPVFASFETVLGPAIYERLYPDWLTSHGQAVERICTGDAYTVWVAEHSGRPVGFAAVALHDGDGLETASGQIEMLAVDPDHQRQGIADALIAFALDQMRMAGVRLAVVGTGGDPATLQPGGPMRRLASRPCPSSAITMPSDAADPSSALG